MGNKIIKGSHFPFWTTIPITNTNRSRKYTILTEFGEKYVFLEQKYSCRKNTGKPYSLICEYIYVYINIFYIYIYICICKCGK